jgi:hypothetical protein
MLHLRGQLGQRSILFGALLDEFEDQQEFFFVDVPFVVRIQFRH